MPVAHEARLDGRNRNGNADAAAAERQPLLAGAGSGPEDGEETAVGGAAGTFRRNLGTVEAFAIVISIVIGSGVFTSPGPIDTNVPSPGVGLLVWLVGGVLAWTGASTMAELGTAIPGEGWSTGGMRRDEARLLTVLQAGSSPI